jgi:hypothetical protein
MIEHNTERAERYTMIRIVGVFALMFFTMLDNGGCHSKSQEVGMEIKLYYVNIGVETLVPVTPDEMEQKGSYCEIASTSDADKIRKILTKSVASSSASFLDKSTRVKLKNMDNSLIAFIDNYGGVRFAGGKDARISATDLAKMKRVIESRCGF